MKQKSFVVTNFILIALLCTVFTNCDPRTNDSFLDTKHHEITSVKEAGYNFLHAYRTVLRNGLRGLTGATRRKITQECLANIYNIYTNDNELLMQYVDALGKPKSGYLRGNVVWLGSYSECRDIPNAHYCTANVLLSVQESKDPRLKALGALWGLCFPSNCTAQDISFILKDVATLIEREVAKLTEDKINVMFSKENCPPVKPTYTTGVKVTIGLCGFLLFLCLIGTVLDYLDETFNSPISGDKIDIVGGQINISMVDKSPCGSNSSINEVNCVDESLNEDDVILLNSSSALVRVCYFISCFKASFVGQFFLCFSILQNTAKIFKTDVPPSAIGSINAMRVISITWVILGHTISFFASGVVDNKAGIKKDAQLLSMMAILSGTYSVDTFFFLSGLLVAYTCFRKLQKNDKNFTWFLFYIHRFWRLTPSYMFVILFSIHLKGFLTESPFWSTQFTDTICSKYWWTNLLYINNFYPTNSEICIGWSWYLANDMQFFVITPFLIIPLYKVGWRGLVLPLGLLLEASVITAFIHAHWSLDPLALMKAYKWFLTPGGAMAKMKSLNEYMKYVYYKPYCRIQVYLVGFLLGYVMYRYANTKERIPGWITALLGWSVAAVLGMLLVYGPHKSVLPEAEEWNQAENVLYGTFHRFLWGLVLAWVTYACHYGAGGLVQKFLSAKFWIPLSRLTYNVYLIHYIILILMFIGAQDTLHYDLHTAIYYFLANVLLSYGAAYVLAVVIEFPCANLEALILKYIRKARRNGGD